MLWIKRFARRWRAASPLRACMAVYAVIIGAVMLVQTLLFCYDEILYATGKLQQQSLCVDDFELIGQERADAMTLITAVEDSQMLYTGTVRSLKIRCRFSLDPGEFLVFYQTDVNAGFRADRCVYAQQRDGWYVFTLPRGVEKIRLDTGVVPSVWVSFDEILLNHHTFADSFRFTTSELTWLVVLPGMLYALLDLLLYSRKQAAD